MLEISCWNENEIADFQLEIKHTMVEVSEFTPLVLVWLIPNFKKPKRGKKYR